MQKRITNHAKQFLKTYHSSIRYALKREINAYLQNKKQNNINNQLKQLKLAKLTKKDISERDLVNIIQLNAYPIKPCEKLQN